MNNNDMHRAYRELRQRAPEEDKDALIARLHREEAPAKRSLFLHWFERFKRPEFAGLAMASVLTLMVAVGVPMYQKAGEFGPQVEEMDYDGGQAMVIEDKTQHTTLIWLSDADDDNEDDDEDTPAVVTPEKI